MIFFIKNEKKMNESFAWTEQKLKRNLNSLSYFKKSAGYIAKGGEGDCPTEVILVEPNFKGPGEF